VQWKRGERRRWKQKEKRDWSIENRITEDETNILETEHASVKPSLKLLKISCLVSLSSAATAMSVQWLATRWTVQGSNLGTRKGFFHPPKFQDRLLGPANLQFNKHRGYFPRVKRSGRNVDSTLPTSAEVKNERSHASIPTPTPPTPKIFKTQKTILLPQYHNRLHAFIIHLQHLTAKKFCPDLIQINRYIHFELLNSDRSFPGISS
jgi:hypothetical protein